MKKHPNICRFIIMFLVFLLFTGTLYPYVSAAQTKAYFSTQTLVFNGEEKTLDAYTIDGYTYFRLRDAAALCSSTAYRFSLETDEAKKHVKLVRFGENTYLWTSKSGNDMSATCVKSSWTLEADGKNARCNVYNIGGNNFYRLRDLADIIGFSVGYDAENRRVLVFAEPLDDDKTLLNSAFSALSKLYSGEDYANAISALTLAADKGSSFAAAILAEGYYRGQYGLPCDMTAAAKYAKAGSDGGNIRASYLYALLLRQGKGVAVNIKESLERFGLAAKGGNIDALSFLAEQYYRGTGVDKNDRLAYSYSRLAANFDDPRAHYICALCLYNGRGVMRDLESAAAHFKSAAQFGDTDAVFSLGVCYYNGEGVRFNPYIALSLFKQAAQSGHKSAAENVEIIEQWIEKNK